MPISATWKQVELLVIILTCHGKLKRLVANLSLDNLVWKDIASGNF